MKTALSLCLPFLLALSAWAQPIWRNPATTNQTPWYVANTNGYAYGLIPLGSGLATIQLGSSAVASSNLSIAIGDSATATAIGAISIGQGAQTTGGLGISLGQGSGAGPTLGDMSIGPSSGVTGGGAIAFGWAAYAIGTNSISIGHAANTRTFTNSVAIGGYTTNAADNEVAIGPKQHFAGDGSGLSNVVAVSGTDATKMPTNNGTAWSPTFIGATNFGSNGRTNWETMTPAGLLDTNTAGGYSLLYNGNQTNSGSFQTANATVTGNLTGAGGTFSAPVTSTSSTTNAPANTEFVTGGWVRGLLTSGQLFYMTTNIDTGATNAASSNRLYSVSGVIPSLSLYTRVSPTNGQYVYLAITTNTYQRLQLDVSFQVFLNMSGGTLTMHSEVYYSYDKTNWLGDFECANQTISTGTNLYSFVVPVTTIASTNAAGFYLMLALKVGTATSSPTFNFWMGTNNVSFVSIPGAGSSVSGSAFLPNTQTFTGTNTFTLPIVLPANQITPLYTNTAVARTNLVATFGQEETTVELSTNGVSIALSTNRLSNTVMFANFSIWNTCGSNAVVNLNPNWRFLGSGTNSFILTNQKVLRLSVGFAGRAIAGWNDETNAFAGYSLQP